MQCTQHQVSTIMYGRAYCTGCIQKGCGELDILRHKSANAICSALQRCLSIDTASTGRPENERRQDLAYFCQGKTDSFKSGFSHRTCSEYVCIHFVLLVTGSLFQVRLTVVKLCPHCVVVCITGISRKKAMWHICQLRRQSSGVVDNAG